MFSNSIFGTLRKQAQSPSILGSLKWQSVCGYIVTVNITGIGGGVGECMKVPSHLLYLSASSGVHR